MPDVHARLSASGAKRWMMCTPSVRLEEGFEDKTSTFAEEGTFAHELAELMINYNLGNLKKTEYNKCLTKLKKNAYYNEELMEYISGYVATVWELINEAKKEDKYAEVLTEQRLDFSAFVPEGFGTGDVIIITDEVIHVIDLKYGKGVGVVAKDNPQLRLYGLGAIETFGMIYDFKSVKMTIVQPRLDNMTSEELLVEDLTKWGEDTVKPLAELAMKGEGKFVPGDHCRFCKARATCRARAEANLELTKMEFAKGDTLSDDEIGEVLRQADQLANWVKDIADYALQEAVNGKKYDGWKVVEGRSNRKYVDEIKVSKKLQSEGFEEAVLYEKKLYGITAMEKLVGKKKLTDILGDLIVKPTGKATLVPESDKRPELNSSEAAKNDFDDCP